MNIRFLSLNQSSDNLNNEIIEAFAAVIERGNFILGEEVSLFEKEWADFCHAAGAVGVGNGTDAITLALIASGAVQKNEINEVITTPLSAGYTSLAILNAGATPVFVDIDENTLNLNPARIESAITPHTRAIIPVHLYGQKANMPEIYKIARRHNLFVIEDAAQAHGVSFAESLNEADRFIATFSFYPTKNLGAMGDGGAIISNDPDFLRTVRALRQGGHFEALQGYLIGKNSRLDEIHAALLRVKLKKLREWNTRRSELAGIYFDRLKNSHRVKLTAVKNASNHAFHLFVIRHPERDKLRNFLFGNGVETLIHYPFLLHQQNLFRSSPQKVAPVAERIVKEILSLPLYPQMTNDEVEHICRLISEFENEHSSALSHDANR
jgi:dTDP-4-amino-4,6-dideoxygalactose transaminase